MICNVCKKEWVCAPGDTVCPFCGANLRKDERQHTIPGVIAFLVKKEGADILLKPDTVMSYIADLVKGNDRDKKLMRVGSANGIFQKAHALLAEPKQSRREVMVLDIRQHLMDNAFLSEENAVALLNTVLEGVGMSSLKLSVKKHEKPEPVPQSRTAQAPERQKTPPKKPAQASVNPAQPSGSTHQQKTSAPGSLSQQGSPVQRQQSHPSQQGGGGQQNSPAQQNSSTQQSSPAKSSFRLNSISMFEYDGSSFASRKVQGPLFLKGELRMIGILVTYPPAPHNMKVSLDWQIFHQDGSSMTGLIHGVGSISKGDTDFYQGWGWNVPGHWQPGRYTVKASMNGSNQLVTYFDVVEGKYDNPLLTMTEVRLFSAGAVPPELKDRKYSAVFSSHQARRIYFEIRLAKMNTSVYTTLNYKITKSSGEIFANYSVPIRFRSGDDRCWTGFGWDVPGHWQKGRYGYEISIGEVNNIFRGVFDIV